MTTSLETMKDLMTQMRAAFQRMASSSLAENRQRFDETALTTVLPPDITIEPATIDDHLDGDWIIPAAANDSLPLLLFCHGGGYSVGSSLSHRPLCARIATSAGCKIFSLNYRLAPEHKYPAALEDALQAYRWLRENNPHRKVILIGDSAGGGLVMATLLAIKQKELPMPCGAVGISAWLDLECSSPSYAANKSVDMMASAEGLRFVGRGYANKQINKDPFISPFYATDLSGLCPLLIQIGSAETLLDENVKFAEQAKQDGVTVELQIWPNMVHVWHSLYGQIPEAKEAIDAIGLWIKGR